MGKGGGGGGGTPTQTTAYQTNLPEYAQPYVENMLQAAQRQIYTDGMSSFRPYQPYSTDPTKYFAGPSGLQQQVYREAEGMQAPSQYAPATGIAGAAGLGQLGAGQQFASQATSPGAVQAFMSPYQQSVTDVAKAAAIREAQMADRANRLAAARQGTYGGARETLGRIERERNLLSNLSNIQAQGAQSAYDRAMQNLQFGANLGLQGLGAASQTAGTLAGIGSQQQQADLARMGFQQQTGAAQQQFQQNIINQAIQDYATQQQYPMMQLGFLSNMLRGLPMQATTTQTYMPTPSLGTQAIAGLGTLYGVGKGTGMFKEGGEIKGFAGPEGSVVGGMRAKLEALVDGPNGVQQVTQIRDTSPSMEMRKLANEVLMEKRMEQQAAAQAEASIAQDQMPRGLAAAPAPVMDTLEAAGGGIVAFAGDDEEEGSLVNYDPNKVYKDPYQVLSDAEAIALQKGRRKMAGIGDVISPEYKEHMEKQRAGLPGLKERATGWDIADIFSGMYQSAVERPGQGLIGQLTSGAAKAAPGIRERQRELTKSEEAIAKAAQDVYGRERADLIDILGGATKTQEEARKRIASREEKRIANNQRTTDLMQIYNVKLMALKQQGKDINDPLVQDQAMTQALLGQGGRQYKVEKDIQDQIGKEMKADPYIGEKGSYVGQLKILQMKPKKTEKDLESIAELEQKIFLREQFIENRARKRGGTSGSGDVINVDKLPPKE